MKFNASASTPDASENSFANLESFLSCQDGPADMYPNNNFTVFCPKPKNETPVQLENFISPFDLGNYREVSGNEGKELTAGCSVVFNGGAISFSDIDFRCREI